MSQKKPNDSTPNDSKSKSSSRREFLQDGSKIAVAGAAAGAAMVPNLSVARTAFAGGSDTIKIGLVGCGGRGTGAASQAMHTESGNVELVAMGDAFPDRLANSLKANTREHADKVQVPEAKQFIGFDAYQDVLASDIDLVILATPPGFRPLHFEAAVKAGKHVFMEKPVAVDAPGVRRVLAAGELAKQKGLLVQVGLQRRHERAYRETIAELKNGIIGDLVCTRVYWNGNGVWMKKRSAMDPAPTELEYQMRNWYYFNWICGDHIVEQHIHNLDVGNWLMDDFPVKANGMGGRQVRTMEDSGQIFDHHSVEYTYANGHKMFSQCRHIPDCWRSVSEWVHGSKGYADVSGGRIFDQDGKEIFKCNEGKGQRGGHQQEHHDLFADIRGDGEFPNEAEYGAKSTFTAILGRLATYTGKELNWKDAIESNISLANVDDFKGWNDEAPVNPDENGNYPIAVPGVGHKEFVDWELAAPKKKKKAKAKKKKA